MTPKKNYQDRHDDENSNDVCGVFLPSSRTGRVVIIPFLLAGTFSKYSAIIFQTILISS